MAMQPIHGDDARPLTPEEMKAIGEIELGPSRHEMFLNNHYKKLILGLVIFMLLATAGIVYGTWRAKQEADGASAALAAMQLSAPGGAAEAEAFDPAVIARIESQYAGTHAAATAELMRGMQLVAGEEEQQGIAILEQVAATSPESFLRVRAQAFLAGRHMSGGELEKAAQLWQQVARNGNSPYLALAYLSLGDIAQEKGELDQASGYYKQLQQSCPSSPLQVTAQQRLLMLGVDAPEPVAPPPAQEGSSSSDEMPEWTPIGLPGGLSN